MAKKRARAAKDFDSLIPEIKTEEKRLEELLAAARAEAGRILADAEAEAAARIRASRAALPQMTADRRESLAAAMRQEAAVAARAEEERTRALEKAAGAAVEKAAAHVVSLVWPGAAP
jgi:hypothetical protein